MPELAALLAKSVVDHRTNCRLWLAAMDGRGYGKLKWCGRLVGAHRLAFAAAAAVPLSALDGVTIRHRCDRPACVNPAHLDAGTTRDNVRDMIDRGRQAPTIRGLSIEDIKAIALDPRPSAIVAKTWGLSDATVRDHRARHLAEAATGLGLDPAAVRAAQLARDHGRPPDLIEAATICPLPVADVARRYGVPRNTVKRWIKSRRDVLAELGLSLAEWEAAAAAARAAAEATLLEIFDRELAARRAKS